MSVFFNAHYILCFFDCITYPAYMRKSPFYTALPPLPHTSRHLYVVVSIQNSSKFKYALAYLPRCGRMRSILPLTTPAIRRRLYLGRRLDSHQDKFVLLTTYRGGSLIYFQDNTSMRKYKKQGEAFMLLFASAFLPDNCPIYLFPSGK